MGGLVSSALDANMKKQQDFMLQSQKMQMERQLAMQNIMRERMMAMQMGRTRELLQNWSGPFAGVVTLAALIAGVKKRNPKFLVPLFPVYMVVGYQSHLVYGNKTQLIRRNADRYLTAYPDIFVLPQGPVTMDEIDLRRMELKVELKDVEL